MWVCSPSLHPNTNVRYGQHNVLQSVFALHHCIQTQMYGTDSIMFYSVYLLSIIAFEHKCTVQTASCSTVCICSPSLHPNTDVRYRQHNVLQCVFALHHCIRTQMYGTYIQQLRLGCLLVSPFFSLWWRRFPVLNSQVFSPHTIGYGE